MDIMVLAVFLFVAFVAISLDFVKKAPYLSVLGGIILIFLGLGLVVNASITTSFCDFNSVNVTIDCVDKMLSVPFSSNFYQAVGLILAVVGVGVIVDNVVRYGEEARY